MARRRKTRGDYGRGGSHTPKPKPKPSSGGRTASEAGLGKSMEAAGHDVSGSNRRTHAGTTATYTGAPSSPTISISSPSRGDYGRSGSTDTDKSLLPNAATGLTNFDDASKAVEGEGISPLYKRDSDAAKRYREQKAREAEIEGLNDLFETHVAEMKPAPIEEYRWKEGVKAKEADKARDRMEAKIAAIGDNQKKAAKVYESFIRKYVQTETVITESASKDGTGIRRTERLVPLTRTIEGPEVPTKWRTTDNYAEGRKLFQKDLKALERRVAKIRAGKINPEPAPSRFEALISGVGKAASGAYELGTSIQPSTEGRKAAGVGLKEIIRPVADQNAAMSLGMGSSGDAIRKFINFDASKSALEQTAELIERPSNAIMVSLAKAAAGMGWVSNDAEAAAAQNAPGFGKVISGQVPSEERYRGHNFLKLVTDNDQVAKWGILLDILLDPITYVGGGYATVGAKSAIRSAQISKRIVAANADDLAEETIDAMTRQAAQSGDWTKLEAQLVKIAERRNIDLSDVGKTKADKKLAKEITKKQKKSTADPEELERQQELLASARERRASAPTVNGEPLDIAGREMGEAIVSSVKLSNRNPTTGGFDLRLVTPLGRRLAGTNLKFGNDLPRLRPMLGGKGNTVGSAESPTRQALRDLRTEKVEAEVFAKWQDPIDHQRKFIENAKKFDMDNIDLAKQEETLAALIRRRETEMLDAKSNISAKRMTVGEKHELRNRRRAAHRINSAANTLERQVRQKLLDASAQALKGLSYREQLRVTLVGLAKGDLKGEKVLTEGTETSPGIGKLSVKERQGLANIRSVYKAMAENSKRTGVLGPGQDIEDYVFRMWKTDGKISGGPNFNKGTLLDENIDVASTPQYTRRRKAPAMSDIANPTSLQRQIHVLSNNPMTERQAREIADEWHKSAVVRTAAEHLARRIQRGNPVKVDDLTELESLAYRWFNTDSDPMNPSMKQADQPGLFKVDQDGFIKFNPGAVTETGQPVVEYYGFTPRLYDSLDATEASIAKLGAIKGEMDELQVKIARLDPESTSTRDDMSSMLDNLSREFKEERERLIKIRERAERKTTNRIFNPRASTKAIERRERKIAERKDLARLKEELRLTRDAHLRAGQKWTKEHKKDFIQRWKKLRKYEQQQTDWAKFTLDLDEIRSRDWYHGSGNPNMSAKGNPRLLDPNAPNWDFVDSYGFAGRGGYLTASPFTAEAGYAYRAAMGRRQFNERGHRGYGPGQVGEANERVEALYRIRVRSIKKVLDLEDQTDLNMIDLVDEFLQTDVAKGILDSWATDRIAMARRDELLATDQRLMNAHEEWLGQQGIDLNDPFGTPLSQIEQPTIEDLIQASYDIGEDIPDELIDEWLDAGKATHSEIADAMAQAPEWNEEWKRAITLWRDASETGGYGADRMNPANKEVFTRFQHWLLGDDYRFNHRQYGNSEISPAPINNAIAPFYATSEDEMANLLHVFGRWLNEEKGYDAMTHMTWGQNDPPHQVLVLLGDITNAADPLKVDWNLIPRPERHPMWKAPGDRHIPAHPKLPKGTEGSMLRSLVTDEDWLPGLSKEYMENLKDFRKSDPGFAAVLDPRELLYYRANAEARATAMWARFNAIDKTVGRNMSDVERQWTAANGDRGSMRDLKPHDVEGQWINRKTGVVYQKKEIKFRDGSLVPVGDDYFRDVLTGEEYARAPTSVLRNANRYQEEAAGQTAEGIQRSVLEGNWTEERLWPTSTLQDLGTEMTRAGEFGQSVAYANAHDALYRKYLQLSRFSVTTYWPAFHVRNMISDVILSLQADTGVLFHPIIATKLAMGSMAGRTPGKIKIKTGPGRGQYVNMEWEDVLLMSDIWGFRSGLHAADIMTLTDDQLMTNQKFGGAARAAGRSAKRGFGFGPSGKVGQFAGRMSMRRENIIRFITFRQRLQRNGGDAADAMWHTIKHHFDYNDLTAVERNQIRNLFLFYTWYRKNIPLQFTMLIQRPGFFAAVNHIQNATFEGEAPWNQDWSKLHHLLPDTSGPVARPGFIPDYMMDLAGVSMSWNEASFTFGFGNPMADLNMLSSFVRGWEQGGATGVLKQGFSEISSLANPGIQFWLRGAFNVDPLTGRTLKASEPTGQSAAIDWILRKLGHTGLKKDQYGRPLLPEIINRVVNAVPGISRGMNTFAPLDASRDQGFVQQVLGGPMRNVTGLTIFSVPGDSVEGGTEGTQRAAAMILRGFMYERLAKAQLYSNDEKKQQAEQKKVEKKAMKWIMDPRNKDVALPIAKALGGALHPKFDKTESGTPVVPWATTSSGWEEPTLGEDSDSEEDLNADEELQQALDEQRSGGSGSAPDWAISAGGIPLGLSAPTPGTEVPEPEEGEIDALLEKAESIESGAYDRKVRRAINRGELLPPSQAQDEGDSMATIEEDIGVRKKIPRKRKVKLAHKILDAREAMMGGIELPDKDEETFVNTVARETGMSPKVLLAWFRSEGGNQFGDWNRLNIGHFDSGPGGPAMDADKWSDPTTAAKWTVEFMRGNYGGASDGILAILPNSRNKPDDVQIANIANSGWATNPNYHGLLSDVYNSITEPMKDPDPKAKKRWAKLVEKGKEWGIYEQPKGGTGMVYPLSQKGTMGGGPEDHAARAFGNWMSDNAVDINAPVGTNVRAITGATVTRVVNRAPNHAANPAGSTIYLKDDEGEEYSYMHLETTSVKPGQRVQPGQVIGKSGAANSVPHLHFATMNKDPEVVLGQTHMRTAKNNGPFVDFSPDGPGSTSRPRLLAGDSGGQTILRFQKPFAKALLALARASGEPLQINEGTRSYERQKELYENPELRSGPAAPPGTSNHEGGAAADIQLTPRQIELLPEFGLSNTVVPNEPWHVELVSGPGAAKIMSTAEAVEAGINDVKPGTGQIGGGGFGGSIMDQVKAERYGLPPGAAATVGAGVSGLGSTTVSGGGSGDTGGNGDTPLTAMELIEADDELAAELADESSEYGGRLTPVPAAHDVSFGLAEEIERFLNRKR